MTFLTNINIFRQTTMFRRLVASTVVYIVPIWRTSTIKTCRIITIANIARVRAMMVVTPTVATG